MKKSLKETFRLISFYKAFRLHEKYQHSCPLILRRLSGAGRLPKELFGSKFDDAAPRIRNDDLLFRDLVDYYIMHEIPVNNNMSDTG